MTHLPATSLAFLPPSNKVSPVEVPILPMVVTESSEGLQEVHASIGKLSKCDRNGIAAKYFRTAGDGDSQAHKSLKESDPGFCVEPLHALCYMVLMDWTLLKALFVERLLLC